MATTSKGAIYGRQHLINDSAVEGQVRMYETVISRMRSEMQKLESSQVYLSIYNYWGPDTCMHFVRIFIIIEIILNSNI